MHRPLDIPSLMFLKFLWVCCGSLLFQLPFMLEKENLSCGVLKYCKAGKFHNMQLSRIWESGKFMTGQLHKEQVLQLSHRSFGKEFLIKRVLLLISTTPDNFLFYSFGKRRFCGFGCPPSLLLVRLRPVFAWCRSPVLFSLILWILRFFFTKTGRQ